MAALDKYLSDERCSSYTYVTHDKIKFHRLHFKWFLFICLYSFPTVNCILSSILFVSQLKVCVTLIIAASLEVEHGIENLWKTSSNGFKSPADYGQYIPVHYFRTFVCGFPFLWSPEQSFGIRTIFHGIVSSHLWKHSMPSNEHYSILCTC